ncbi:hypothetical protein ACFL6U_33210, partial [Planctomycetota bacterium]
RQAAGKFESTPESYRSDPLKSTAIETQLGDLIRKLHHKRIGPMYRQQLLVTAGTLALSLLAGGMQQ